MTQAQSEHTDTIQQPNLHKTDSNVSYPARPLSAEVMKLQPNKKNKSEIAGTSSHNGPAYLQSAASSFPNNSLLSSQQRQIYPPPEGLPPTAIIYVPALPISEENDGLYHINRLKIAGLITMMAIINLLYGIFIVNPTCNDPNAAEGSCNSVVTGLVLYDVFGLVYLGINMTFYLIDVQRLDGYCICLLTFKKNTRQECWHFGFGVLFALVTVIMCFIAVVMFIMYVAEYCLAQEREEERVRDVPVEVPQMSNNQIVRDS